MLRTEVTVGGCCWAVETTIRRSLFYEVNAKILCFCGQRSHPQVFTGRSLLGAPHIAHFAMCGFRHDRNAWRSHSHHAALLQKYYSNPQVKWRTQHPHTHKERECV